MLYTCRCIISIPLLWRLLYLVNVSRKLFIYLFLFNGDYITIVKFVFPKSTLFHLYNQHGQL